MNAKAHIDHLVIAAATLEEGLRWCKDTLGVTPGPGGAHALFGTHNLLVRLQSMKHPLAYLEIIAIDPSAVPARDPGLRRWFDLDATSIRQQLRHAGPQLLHWVVSVPDVTSSVVALHTLGIERGTVIEASRPTTQGLLRWKITVRDDGQRLYGGVLPTLIEWGAEHPARTLTGPSLELRSLRLQHPQADQLVSALKVIGMHDLPVFEGPPRLSVELATEQGTPLWLHHDEPA